MYNQFQILTRVFSFGLFDFWNFAKRVDPVYFESVIQNMLYYPKTIESYKFCQENNIKIDNSESSIFENSMNDFNYFLFLEKTIPIKSYLYFSFSIGQNEVISRYIIEKQKPEKRAKWLLFMESEVCIDYYHWLGYKFSFEDFPSLFKHYRYSDIFAYCLTK